MLVLSRKRGESIRINDDITITVLEMRGDKIRLGIEAPKVVPVHREEVYVAIQRQKSQESPVVPDMADAVIGSASVSPVTQG